MPLALAANSIDPKIELGERDWTIECWLRLDATAADEAVIFELGVGRRDDTELVTRLTVAPRENALVMSGLGPISANAAAVARRIEYPNPGGPPAGVAELRSAVLAARDLQLPRATWFHLAVVHSADRDELRLFVDGRSRAVARAGFIALPPVGERYVAVGRDGRGQRKLAGLIEDLRVSDRAGYRGDFTPRRAATPAGTKAAHPPAR